MGMGKPWRQGCEEVGHIASAGRKWTGTLVISWLSPPPLFIQFVWDPSRGMVPPTSRGFPPLLVFPATALTGTLGCFLGDSKPRHVDSED